MLGALSPDPRLSGGETPPARYAVHRQVQRHVLMLLGGGLETIQPNSFAPTVYATMRSATHRPDRESYAYLQGMLDALSQYPDARVSQTLRRLPPFAGRDLIVRVQALRAAHTLVRAALPLGVVSRLEGHALDRGEGGTRRRGLLESHRVRLRWILQKARTLDQESADQKSAKSSSAMLGVLYRDEVAWLHNEIGLACLMQGQLRDAVAHLRQAIEVNRKIEGFEKGGRLNALFSLNLAVVQIERGRLEAAQGRLVIAQKDIRGAGLEGVVAGYRALVDHLRGRDGAAERGFAGAIAKLERSGNERGLTIMLNHQARFLARHDRAAAERALGKAQQMAEAGGHEDLRHHILLSLVQVSQFTDSTETGATARRSADLARLDEIDGYAKAMGMISLRCDAAHRRARLLTLAGDSSSAGELLVFAMSLARRHGLRLRLASMMVSYAQVLFSRRRVTGATRLLQTALEMSQQMRYEICSVRIQSRLDQFSKNAGVDSIF